MPIYYKTVSKRPGGIAGKILPKYYPALTGRTLADLEMVSKEIAARSTFTRADIAGVLESFSSLIPELLADGYNVKLDGLGSFSLHVSGKGQEDPEKVSSKDITKVKMAFLPSKRIKKALTQLTFRKHQKG